MYFLAYNNNQVSSVKCKKSAIKLYTLHASMYRGIIKGCKGVEEEKKRMIGLFSPRNVNGKADATTMS